MRNIRQDIEKLLCDIETEVVTEKDLDIEKVYMLFTRAAMEIDWLKEINSEQGWRLNPDRMGGQFTDAEINRRDEGW